MVPRMKRALHFAVVFASVALWGCERGEDGPPDSGPTPYVPPPKSAIVDASPVAIRREVIEIPAPAPPGNPEATANRDTPPEFNKVRVVRYRVDSDPPRPARAIAILMPGFLGGASSYDPMARALVRRSTPDAAIEAWAIDRRANFLEDHHGLDVAEVRGDPELAHAYYFNQTPQEGKTYDGLRPPESLAYMSEWGLASTVNDLRAVLELVPKQDRRSRVVLVGHSLGASIVEEYAAWDFDGHPGYEDLAALVLVDGVSGAEGKAQPPITQKEYETGFGSGTFVRAGLNKIRRGEPFFVLPLLGSDVYLVAAISALRATWRPMDVTGDPDRDAALRVLLGLSQVPDMTNRAALGFSFDNDYNGLTFAAVSCGHADGGLLGPYTGALGDKLMHPIEPQATYFWVNYDKSSSAEFTSLDDLARSWYQGPGLDFAEWYFPNRLSLDAPAAGTLVLGTGDWPLEAFQLRAKHGRHMDLPIFGFATALVGKGKGDTTAFDALRSLVMANPIGPNRAQAGMPRNNPDAFRVLGYGQLTHMDPLMGADDPNRGQVHAWYKALYEFIMLHTTQGGAVLPIPTP